jgi:hypothetical protein
MPDEAKLVSQLSSKKNIEGGLMTHRKQASLKYIQITGNNLKEDHF